MIFTSHRVKLLENKIEELKYEIEGLYIENESLKREAKFIKRDMEISFRESTAKLSYEKNKYEAENEILKKAFTNLGFDVKDMKDILNKLVEGIISKNTVSIIK